MANNLNKQYRNVALSSTADLVATGNNNLIAWNIINPNDAAVYVKFYNAAAANDVTVGTTTPVKTLFIPATGTALLSNEEYLQNGFNLGIVVACVTELDDSETTAPTKAIYCELQYSNNPQ